MCFVSLVMQQFEPYVPDRRWQGDYPPTWPAPKVQRSYTDDELRVLLEAFRKAYEAAERFDQITGQPDCVDPEKAELIERVAALEAKLDAIADAAKDPA